MAISRSAVLKALSDTEEKVRPLAGEMAELVHEVVRQCKQAVWLVPECGIPVFCTCVIHPNEGPSIPDAREIEPNRCGYCGTPDHGPGAEGIHDVRVCREYVFSAFKDFRRVAAEKVASLERNLGDMSLHATALRGEILSACGAVGIADRDTHGHVSVVKYGEIHDPLVAVRMLAVKLATANAIVVRYDRMIQDMRALYQARIDGSYAEHARGICDRASCAFCERERLQP
jgi:hypothetical protein